ncbi:MAG: hypothetical protein LPH21_18430 [Shewanella sp.]|nr:hypothetical protein [Shewanella sp.]
MTRTRSRAKAQAVAIPEGINVLYADPPWSYNDKAASGKRGVEFKYPPMPIPDIMGLDVKNKLADDAVCFLWATCPLLKEGIATLEAWGFTFKTVAFVWVKKNRSSEGYFMGMGNWTRTNAELVLIGVRGKAKRISKGVRQILTDAENGNHEPFAVERRIQAHSQKPLVVRQRIEQLMGTEGVKVELFARDVAEGWHQYGHDIQGDDFDIRSVL